MIQTLFLTSMSASASSCLASSESIVAQFFFERRDALALRVDVGLVFLLGASRSLRQFFADWSRPVV